MRKLPDNDVTIETDASFKTVISCEKAKFNIIGKSGDDFLTYHMLREMSLLSFHNLPLKRLSDRQFSQLLTMTTIN